LTEALLARGDAIIAQIMENGEMEIITDHWDKLRIWGNKVT